MPCLGFLAVGQDKAAQSTGTTVSKEIKAMRRKADTYGKEFAKYVQAHAVKVGKYGGMMTDYAVDFGGQIPINPCTGTRTGYTRAVSEDGKTASVAAMAGYKCGQWTPKVYRLALKH